MEDDLRPLVAQCGISVGDSRQVRERASEILRKMGALVPLGALGKARSCKSLLAIELACRVLNKMFIKEMLMAQTQVSTKDFQQALQNCKSLLKLSFTKASAIVAASGNTKLEVAKMGSECSRSGERSPPTRIACVCSERAETRDASRRSRSIMRHRPEDPSMHPLNLLVPLA